MLQRKKDSGALYLPSETKELKPLAIMYDYEGNEWLQRVRANLQCGRWTHAMGRLSSTTTGNSSPVMVEFIEGGVNPQAAFEFELRGHAPNCARRFLPPS